MCGQALGGVRQTTSGFVANENKGAARLGPISDPVLPCRRIADPTETTQTRPKRDFCKRPCFNVRVLSSSWALSPFLSAYALLDRRGFHLHPVQVE